ncbi:PA14 domain-containing protein [Pseudosulfitobacter koreensis]|uniref:PA14 domain-containing protein n=1 Tax=Pseudosulfitobacter koreensis TaxID=2968472 RepID=A0ABT1Z3R2_9RHOB|nr:PA14 domain-containing protein [Pseudosulfitobacter koreense]MCR8827760.1 PA14 domain-containing protein [Pseudosulfitobacter koreense]
MTCLASTLWSAPLELVPADPQPGDLNPGLAVRYAYPPDVKSLEQAARLVEDATPGTPLSGLDYRDTADGDLTLTSAQAHNVVAGISGYVRFDASGTYVIDFLSNDGLQASIGGQEVVYFDGRHPCEESEAVEVNVPVPGWYEIEALYFQRTGSACLHMRAGQGEMEWMEDAAFGH